MSELAVLVKNINDLTLQFALCRQISVDVTLVVIIENIFYNGCAENKVHLALRHAAAQLVEHFLSDDVALLNVDFINAGKRTGSDKCA